MEGYIVALKLEIDLVSSKYSTMTSMSLMMAPVVDYYWNSPEQ